MKQTDIPAVYDLLGKEYSKHEAPLAEFEMARTEDPFRVLVATILSARTKDETTAPAVERLFQHIQSPADLAKMPVSQIEKLIFPVGFFHTKARHLQQLPGALEKEFHGKIPDSIDDLCRLPGVGRKTANLVRAVAFNKPAICVDVHVHRICNRLGLLKTKTPLETEMRLRKILPERYWIQWNGFLVSFGQTLCRPITPHCSKCPIRRYCRQIGVQKKT